MASLRTGNLKHVRAIAFAIKAKKAAPVATATAKKLA